MSSKDGCVDNNIDLFINNLSLHKKFSVLYE
jgi:hypothetical protein